MRNLTLGTIIVVGGLLAAIPFRRDAVHPEASDPNALATGPTSASFGFATADQTDLPWQQAASQSPHAPTTAQTASGGWPEHMQPDPMAEGTAAPSRSQAFAQPSASTIPSHQAARPRRDTRLPLTYDDLAVPLSNPHFPDQRFNALAGSTSNPMQPSASPQIGMAEARVNGPGTSPANRPAPGTSQLGMTERELSANEFARRVENQIAREDVTPAKLTSSTHSGPSTSSQPRQQVLRPPTVDLHRQAEQATAPRSFRFPEVAMPEMPPAPSVMERQRHWIRQPD
ncbi:hypothetical protein [Rhodopirellula halodulae]|uniref:hypothetical protein n=1 Tax=Rhodopirellula halodulae TaxID=2894198 RepID=UPI001E2A3868|nr:hypothetical protein [Rhodopirellula sp. JC737]MCC9655623.1 hypothetical protein [Rhodopirellula sp. JC737]